ncbi:MAG: flagellar biosynthetic protein FliO [Bradyrhizobium sp.]|uniref:flagellar biosynthetic protein FliO n=1 Tax=Bradyrhizobium sp. TaxID=376 RepID=UPI00239EFF54|nr:flagellar biosynthetic protein FliO [Bradyrhizobium sp.]MDE2601139.1 flagellar biosynthetic protein FliO [Bradyrhizobium sp.]
MQALTFIFALVAVLALIGAGAWLLRRFAGNRLSTNTNRGRGPRLAVIDAAAVDGRRRLVLVRRDNVEHLLMIGGPTDIVVEPNIVRATPARDPMAPRSSVGSEPQPRIAPLPDGGWSDGDGSRSDASDHAEPQMPEPRPPFADEVRRSASPRLERRGDPLTGLSPEPLAPQSGPRDSSPAAPKPPRTEPVIPRPARQETAKPAPSRAERPAASPPAPTPPEPASTLSSADQNLAEMAQRLEAALRRPGEPRVGAPPVAPEPSPGRTASPVETPGPKTGFENLEDEMASLLGRPKSPS